VVCSTMETPMVIFMLLGCNDDLGIQESVSGCLITVSSYSKCLKREVI
jgi:hypothetical protein